MCGLFGMIGPGITQTDLLFLQEIGYVSALRGRDGTGVVQGSLYEKYCSHKIKKEDSEYSQFMWYHQNCKGGSPLVLNDTTCNYFLGHVRHATKGAINSDNTHPFDVGQLVGMHNGTLKDLKYDHKDKTDTELLLKDIQERGPLRVLREISKDSAYAIVYLDKREKQIVFARNEKRTLFYTYHVHRSVMYYASEKWMLEAIADRNDIVIGDLYRVEAGYIHKISPRDIEKGKPPGWRVTPIAVPEVELIKKDNVLLLPRAQETRTLLEGLNQHRHRIDLPNEEAEEAFFQDNRKGNKRKPRLKGKRRKRAEFIEACLGCGSMLDLYDQYLGKEVPETGRFTCALCGELTRDLEQRLH